MRKKPSFRNLIGVLAHRPHAYARLSGSKEYPHLTGNVWFYQTEWGVLTAVSVAGLPRQSATGSHRIFGFHIHSGTQCSGTETDLFADVLTHYNPDDLSHPYHAGDLPPLFENRGYAFQVFLTDRFTVREILHRTVIIHDSPDDFTSQPAGNAGKKIACGQITPCSERGRNLLEKQR